MQERTTNRVESARRFAWARLAKRLGQCRKEMDSIAADYGPADLLDLHALMDEIEALEEEAVARMFAGVKALQNG